MLRCATPSPDVCIESISDARYHSETVVRSRIVRTRSLLQPLAVLVSVAFVMTACSSGTKTTPTTTAAVTTVAPPASTAAGASTAGTTGTPAPATAGAAGATGTGTTGIDACGQPAPDGVATTFVSSIAYGGPDTYDQCFVGNAVSADQIQKIIDKKFSAIQVVSDASNNTSTFTAPDGTKMVIAVAKGSNGKYYVSSVTFP